MWTRLLGSVAMRLPLMVAKRLESRTQAVALTDVIAALWLRMMTRADSHVVRELIEGLEHDLLAREQTLWTHMAGHERVPFDDAAERALQAAERALQAEEETVSPRVREFERTFRNLVPGWITAKS